MTEAQTKSFIFPKNDSIEEFLNRNSMNNLGSKKPEVSFTEFFKRFAYPIFIVGGLFVSVHYAMNPVGSI